MATISQRVVVTATVTLAPEQTAQLLSDMPADELAETLAFFVNSMTRLEWEAQSLHIKKSDAIGFAAKQNILTYFRTFIAMMEDE